MMNASGKTLTNTEIALAAALILGAASAALANERSDERGGYVVPGSVDGVNPVYHPGIFGNADAAKAYGFVVSPARKHPRAKAPKEVR